MSGTYEFGKLEDNLFHLCKTVKPDYEKIKAVIAKGADINKEDECGHSILYNCTHWTSNDGSSFMKLTNFFVQSGFDVKNKGLSIIDGLVYSTYNRYIFDTAKILLMSGASGNEKQWEELLSTISIEESYQRCCDGDHSVENIMFDLYELVDAARLNKPVDKICVWQNAVGCTIDKVFACGHIVPIDGKVAFDDAIVFQSGEKYISITGNPNICVFGANYLDGKKICETSTDLASRVNHKIVDITFEHKEVSKSTTYYRQPNIYLHFDDGIAVHFSTNYGEVDEDETTEYYELVDLGVNNIYSNRNSLLSLCKSENGIFKWNTAKNILGSGIDINEIVPSMYGFKTTYLLEAVENSNYKAVEFLLENGANPNLVVNDDSPLNALRYFENSVIENKERLRITELLLKHGADPNLIVGGEPICASADYYDMYSGFYAPEEYSTYRSEYLEILLKYGGKLYI